MKNLMHPFSHGNVHNIPHGTRIGGLHNCRDKLKFEEGRGGIVSHVANRCTLNTTKNLEKGIKTCGGEVNNNHYMAKFWTPPF
jgi:hypothetical protein